MSALGTTWPATAAVPLSARVPAAGRVSIRTLASVAPVSASTKPNWPSVKVCRADWAIVTVLSAAVGALLVAAPPPPVVPLMPIFKRRVTLRALLQERGLPLR